MIHISAPFTEEKIRSLRVGDAVEISGIVLTGRDAVHKYLYDGGRLPDGHLAVLAAVHGGAV